MHGGPPPQGGGDVNGAMSQGAGRPGADGAPLDAASQGAGRPGADGSPFDAARPAVGPGASGPAGDAARSRGVSGAAIGSALPEARATTSALDALALSPVDAVLPGATYRATWSVFAPGSPGRVFRALGEVTPAEIPALGRRSFGLDRARPLYAQLLELGFVLLTADPLRDVVAGHVMTPWRPRTAAPGVFGRREFVDARARGRVKVAVGVRLREADGGTHVSVDLRVGATDPVLRRACAIVGPRTERFAGPVTEGWLAAVSARVTR
jgi:hypothetical protein